MRDEAGYGCYYMGKWHVALNPKTCGFERVYGSNHIGEQGDTAVARAAEAFIAEPPKDGKPYFLNIGLLNPHDICYWGFEYDPSKLSMAEKMKDQLPALPPNFLSEEANNDWSDLQWRFYAYSYFRFVEMVDEEIGRIYRSYLRSPQCGNTIFIFSADHGQGSCILICGFMVQLAGIVSGADKQSAEAIRNIAVLTFISGPIVIFCSGLILRKYPVTREFMEQMESVKNCDRE